MKTIILAALLLTLAASAHAQKVTKDSAGNYHQVMAENKATGHTFTDKTGKVYPLYVSDRGKLYYMRTAKSGNVYRCYIKS